MIQCPENWRCHITVNGITITGLLVIGALSIFVEGGLEVTKLVAAGLIGFLAKEAVGGKNEKTS